MEELLDQLLENPEAAKLIVSELLAKFKPVLYGAIGEMWLMYKDLVNNEDYFKTCALMSMNMFDAYISVGFSDEQAMELLLNERERIRKSIGNSTARINLNNK